MRQQIIFHDISIAQRHLQSVRFPMSYLRRKCANYSAYICTASIAAVDYSSMAERISSQKSISLFGADHRRMDRMEIACSRRR